MKLHNLTPVCVALIGVFFVFTLHANGYPYSGFNFTQDEIEMMELEQSITDDMDTLGYDKEFLMTFAKNLKKAIKVEANESRQLFQGGNFGGGGNQGSFNGVNFGQQEEEEEEEDPNATTVMGPGALGILSGLYGIFSGIGSLSPDRVLASTVNFFPPRDREQAQNLINQALYKPTPSTRAPITMRSKTTESSLNKNGTRLNSTATTGSKDPFPELDFGPGSKPNGMRRTRRTTKLMAATTPFQDDEFDEENKNRLKG